MAPIRVGLIGLSTSTDMRAPGAWAAIAHLPAILEHPSYNITALCNSSIASAEASIAHHNLGPHVKAYENAEDLAQDPNVDFVVVSVNVGKHYELAKPALLAKKDVFVEWPLGANTREAEELTRLAKQANVRTMVGLQARPDPLVVKIEELVDSGRIGKVTSSFVMAQFAGLPVDEWPASAKYYLDINSGGNPFTIYFGHFLDTFTTILSPFTTLHATLSTIHPTITLLDPPGPPTPSHPKTTPDHILLQGRLSSGALASLAYRSVSAAVDSVGIRWLITGTKGELEIVTPEIAWQMGPRGTTLRMRSAEDGSIEDIDFAPAEKTTEVPFPGTNTALLYGEFAKGDKGKVPGFEDAVGTHRLLDRILESAKEGVRG